MKSPASEYEHPTLLHPSFILRQQDKVIHSSKKIRILHLEGKPGDAQLVNDKLLKANINCDICVVSSKEHYTRALQKHRPDIILADHFLPSFNSSEALTILHETCMEIPFILVTDEMTDDSVVDMIRKGADDYIIKGNLHRLPAAILVSVERSRFSKEKQAFSQQILENKERIRAFELALNASEEFNKGVLSSLSAHIAVIDRTGTIIAVNKAWDEFSENNNGSSEYTSLGCNYFSACQKAADGGDLIASQALTGIQKLFNRESQSFEMEYPCHSPNEQRWFILTANIFGEDETKVVTSHQDITQRKKVEQTNNLKANLLNTIGQAVVATDVQGKVNYWNKAAEKMYGWKEEEAIGENINTLTPAQQTKEEGMQIMRELKKGNTWTGEVCFQRRNGTTFPAFVTNAPIYDEQQQLTGIIGISSDISEKRFLQQQILEQQKRTEQKLIQARNNAEAANESKSKFLASMSHELRTPLNAVIGFSKILKSSDLSKEQQGEFLEYIESSGNMLLKLIGDILEISKIEAGKLTIQQEPFLFAETINSALNPYRFKANEKGIEFSISIDSSIPQQVIGDAYITNQILVNLLGNAIKFTKEGKINVAISRLQNVESSDDTVWLQFLIQDTGIGIDKEKGQRIFETFTQADNTIAREFGGSGLGLSIVRRLVLLMGGTIGVKTPGTKLSGKGGPGSVFELILPYTTNAEAVSSNDDEKAIKGNFSFTDLNILVVEDNLMNQKLALHTFSKLGCKVAIAVNGQEAIKMLLHESYSLVFMDLQMPVMDGYEATKIIRNELRSDITIIGLTANAFKEDKESCLTAGMNDFVSKPYTSEQLQQVIIKWLNKKL